MIPHHPDFLWRNLDVESNLTCLVGLKEVFLLLKWSAINEDSTGGVTARHSLPWQPDDAFDERRVSRNRRSEQPGTVEYDDVTAYRLGCPVADFLDRYSLANCERALHRS